MSRLVNHAPREPEMKRRIGGRDATPKMAGASFPKIAGMVLLCLVLIQTTGVAQVEGLRPPLLRPPGEVSLLQIQELAREAADRPDVAGNFLVPFFAGVPAGFLLPVGLLGAPVGLIFGGLGGAVVAGTSYGSYHQEADPGVPLMNRVGVLDPYEVDAFRTAFSARLRYRRLRASLLGGGLGIGLGIGVLALLLSQADF